MGAKKISFRTQIDHDSKYFEELPKGTQALVRELILEAAQNKAGPDCFHNDSKSIESVECHARDGFSPHSFNKGGLEYKNFTDLQAYWRDGYEVAHKDAAKAIQGQIDYSFEMLREEVYNKFKALLDSKGIKIEQMEYNTLQELSEKDEEIYPVFRYLEDQECYFLSDDSSSIMHSIRFMYHGKVNGKHMASVSAAINTEGPYHRSYISWSPGTFCEGAKEVEIEWTTQAELKKKLKATLAKISKEIF